MAFPITAKAAPCCCSGSRPSNSVLGRTDVETKTVSFNKAGYKPPALINQTLVNGRRCIVTKSPGLVWSPARQRRNEELLRPFLGLQAGKSPDSIPLPSQGRLLQLFHSEPDEPNMTRKTSRGGQKIGNDVGAITNGYVRMFVDGDQYSQHRLKWKYHYGKDPNGPLDHINGNRADNRLCNLRETNPLENARNKHVVTSNTGHLGVSYCKRYRRFKADIGVAGRIIHLGGYLALECAVAARQHAERFLYGYTLAELRRAA